jgi:murein DD-endopeptidase MepM/ murein hydrolase activator NlpD
MIRLLRQAVGLLGLAAWLAACNFPTRQLTLDEIYATMDAVTPAPTSTLPPTSTPDPVATPVRNERLFPVLDPPGEPFFYSVRSGDTLEALARRFEVEQGQIRTGSQLSPSGYLPLGEALQIPNILESMSPGGDLIPDAELVYSPTSVDMDLPAFVTAAGGYLSFHVEDVGGKPLSGAAVVQRVADENSVNPRLLLALLEYRGGWVYGAPTDAGRLDYPLGFRIPGRTGLYQELSVAATQLNLGYYGWRAGTMVETTYAGDRTIRWNPTLNAGSAAVLRLFALWFEDRWLDEIVRPGGFAERYQAMFGDPWSRSAAAGPVLPSDLASPALELPFAAGQFWGLTAGPHNAWTSGTPRSALDLSPISGGDPCDVSPWWVTASAAGVIARAGDHAVALDLDGDGRESTGWVLVYYHLADEGLVAAGTRVAEGDRLGHPSCQGGRATGKHVHFARKYNGEWIPADGPVPLVLSGWQVVADPRNYYGTMIRDGQVVSADSGGGRGSTVWR